MKKGLLFFGLFVLLASFTLAQPSQQTNRINLQPYYVNAHTQNLWYNYSFSTETPDGMTSISSAILTFDAWITPTRVFNAKVNNVYCNTKNYTVSTTFATSGRAVVTFDCTNAVVPNSMNNVSIQVTSGNIGSSVSFIDLTYINDPRGDIDVHGTEYIGGDDGKMFLQLLDSSGIPINNSECFLTLWYPNDTILFNDTLMSKLNSLKEGIFYKNFFVPNVEGVYPASAKCYKPLTFNNTLAYITDDFESGTFLGGVGWFNSSQNGTLALPSYGWDVDPIAPSVIVTNATAGTGGCFRGTYCARMSGSAGYIERGFVAPDGTTQLNITMKLKVSSYSGADKLDIEYFDGTFHQLDLTPATNLTNNVWFNRSFVITSANFGTMQLYIGQLVTASSRQLYVDDVNISVIYPQVSLGNDTSYQILRGSGEVHVSKLYSQLNKTLTSNLSVSINSSDIALNVWNYSNRSLTQSISVSDVTNYSRINDSIQSAKNEILINTSARFNILDSSISTLSSLVSQINVSIINQILAVPLNVWSYSTRNLTYYEDKTNYTLIRNNQFNYTQRFDTLDLSVSQVPLNVWSYSTRNLTYYPPQVDLTNYSLISQGVWQYSNRNLTQFLFDNTNYSYLISSLNNSGQLSAIMSLISQVNNSIMFRIDNVDSDVWTYIDRNLTYYPSASVNSSDIAIAVWNYNDRNLTYYQINNITPQAVWEFSNRTLTYYQINNISAQDVWTYNNRTLTYYPSASVNSTEIIEGVWSYATRNLTYYQDTTNYALIQQNQFNYTSRFDYIDLKLLEVNSSIISEVNNVANDVWVYSNRNLTYYPAQVDMINYTLIEQNQFNYTNRFDTLDTNIASIPSSVWSFANRNLTYYVVNNLTAEDVWSHINRTLTYYEQNNISTADIWSYNNRTLTYYPSAEVNTTNLTESIWIYEGRYVQGVVN